MSLLPVPQPYDFARSTERFRMYGPDLATVWRDGVLYRVVAGNEIRIEPARGGVVLRLAAQVADPLAPGRGADATAHVSFLLGLPFDLAAFWARARRDPVLAALEAPLAGYRPPLQPDPWEALVTSISAQQVSLHAAFAVRGRLVERLGSRHGRAWAFPARERVAASTEEELLAVGFSRRKAEYLLGLARSDLDLDALASLPDDDVLAVLTAHRGLGRWSADWFLARALARPTAWPAGDLGVRKAVSHFYGEGRMLSEEEIRGIGERFGPWQNLTAHMLLAGMRLVG